MLPARADILHRGRAAGIPYWLLPAAALVGAVSLLPSSWAAVVALGATASLAVLIKPELAIYLLIFAVPFGSLAELDLGAFSASAGELLIVVGALSWAARTMATRQSRIVFTVLSWPLALFIGILVLSATTAISVALGLKEAAKWGELLLAFLFVVNFVTQRRQLTTIYVCLAAAASVEALLGWYQFLNRSGPEGFLIGERFLRAYGTFGQPNPYAGYLVFVLCLLGGPMIAALTHREHGALPASFKAWALASLVMLAAVLMSLSRGGLLALLLAFCVMAILATRRALGYLVLALPVLAVFLTLGASQLLPAEVTRRVSVVTDYFTLFDAREVILTADNWAIVERMANWQAAWEMFLSKPMLGVGIGNFPLVYPDFALRQWEVPTVHAHNFYLTLLAESGILGMAGYLVFLASFFVFAGRTSAHGAPDSRSFISSKGVVIGVIGAVAALSIHNFFDNLYVHGMSIQVGIALGLIAAIGRERTKVDAV